MAILSRPAAGPVENLDTMKIPGQVHCCFEGFLHRCLMFLGCKKTDDSDTMSDDQEERKKEDTMEDFDDIQLKQTMFEELRKKDLWSEEDIFEAVSVCPDHASAVQYLSHECQICCETYSYSKFVNMTHCNCSFCKNCFIQHFSSIIKEKNINQVKCPICNKPDLENKGNNEESMEFFNLLDTQIHHYLDSATHELFQCKLRNRALMEMPNFRWCSHCPFGIVHEGDTLEMECPNCEKSTCFKCKEQWDDVHKNLTCEQFKVWKMQHTDEKLDAYLAKNGIECPSCRYRFDLWKGGCLHFKCSECQYDFCGGCKQPFYQNTECDFSEECGNKGLHAHHTRDCFYYLRDWDVERLKKLLQHNGIPYASNSKSSIEKIESLLKTQKASHKIHMDKKANKEYNTSSNTEEKEHLVELINANNLDPIDLFTLEELKMELQRWNVAVPEHSDGDSPEAYLQILQKKIKDEIPIFSDLDLYGE